MCKRPFVGTFVRLSQLLGYFKGDALTKHFLLLFVPAVCVVLTGGCVGTEIPACADVSWLDYDRQPVLTDAPKFSADEVTAGAPLTIVIPVDTNTRAVRVAIGPAGEDPILQFYSADTDGDETVEISIDDTDLPAGDYAARRITLTGENNPGPQSAGYRADGPDSLYVLAIPFQVETVRRCIAAILAPGFSVTNEKSSAFQR